MTIATGTSSILRDHHVFDLRVRFLTNPLADTGDAQTFWVMKGHIESGAVEIAVTRKPGIIDRG